MSIRISGPIDRVSVGSLRGVRSATYLGTMLAAWVIGCSSSSSPGAETGQGGSSTVTTGGMRSGTTSGGASQTPSGGAPAASGGAIATGGKQTTGTGGSPIQTGGSPATGGTAPTGGKSSTTPTGGTTARATGGTTANATGGTKPATSGGSSAMPTGGRTSTPGGNTSTGGRSSAMPTGGRTSAPGGNTSTGGSSASAGSSSTPGAPTPSKGCGKTDGAKTLTAGGSKVSGAPTTSTRLSGVTSGGKARLAIIDIPADYDPTKPYRLIFSWRQMGGSDTGNATGLHPAGDGPNFDAEHYAYFGLRRESLNANQPAIFIAPDTDPAGSLWDYNKDSVYFDDLLKLITDNLCIDESRVFTTGFSYGAMMSYGLSNGRASKLRAAVTMAPSQFGASTPSGPIAYMSTTGMDDGTCRWGDANSGGQGCVMTHAKANGCTIPSTLPTAAKGSKKYVCYDFEGCKEGYPVKVCTFDGPHTPSSIDDGTTVGEDGLKAFTPPIAWKFIAQF